MSEQQQSQRETFSSRKAFMFAAIGSAVGLGNIWRFPYVAYDNGGGAFIIPYLIALITAGIPLLLLDYAIGHRYRGSPPLAFRHVSKYFEPFGWWNVLTNVVICTYYAVILGWAVSYTFYSFTGTWGAQPESFFFGEYLKMAKDPGLGLDFVGTVLWPLIGVWLFTIFILAAGVQKGVARASTFFMPLLVVMFVLMVGISLTLPGATKGLDALFTPNWSKLSEPGVWVAAYGQIFFSLSICFGIMITYSSYLKPKSDLGSTGLVVGFANSSFEVLAGIGVFAALGFMAASQGKEVSDVASSGIGLAFIAFPTIINQVQAPLDCGRRAGQMESGARAGYIGRVYSDGGDFHPAVRYDHRPARAGRIGQIHQRLRHRGRRFHVCAGFGGVGKTAAAAQTRQFRFLFQNRHCLELLHPHHA